MCKKKFEETKAKAEGDASAQLNLGYMYFSGKGAERPEEAASGYESG